VSAAVLAVDARGVSSEEAAAPAGVSAAVGVRWFREGGGMLAEGASTYVVLLGTRARTQNGHIRNDTRDVSRRMFPACNRAICRRKCVARDRACTRVTPRNLHGKEGIDGSSPSEGSAKAAQIAAFSVEPTCTASTMRWVWSRLWSFQVQNPLLPAVPGGRERAIEVPVSAPSSMSRCGSEAQCLPPSGRRSRV
jgi:hypothetical protein